MALPFAEQLPLSRVVGVNSFHAGLVSGDISGPETDNPADGRPGCPRRSHRDFSRGSIPMRIQMPLDERYTGATPLELEAWIGAARAELGPRLLILGHHYQRA